MQRINTSQHMGATWNVNGAHKPAVAFPTALFIFCAFQIFSAKNDHREIDFSPEPVLRGHAPPGKRANGCQFSARPFRIAAAP
jgi:hypothetical protein